MATRTINFYKDGDLWIIDNIITPTGNYRMKNNGDDHVSIIDFEGKPIFVGYTINILDSSGNGYSNYNALITAVSDFFVKASASGGGDGITKFLFVDYWEDETGEYPSSFIGREGMLAFISDILVGKLIVKWDDEGGGWGGLYYEIIPQDTVFIHPTTFQRYIFNGTTMVKYDDVNEIVPKWLTYKALLTQSGEDAPVARVLNQDEPDYLGDIVWSRNSAGDYTSNTNYGDGIVFVTNNSNVHADDSARCSVLVQEGAINLFTGNGDELLDGHLSNFPIEIAVRQRGAAPQLLSAETNTTGDKVILTFDKKMSVYNLDTVFGSDGLLIESENQPNFLNYEVEKEKIIVSFDGSFPNTDIIVVGHNKAQPQNFIESFDYGLLEAFENFPVVNNVLPTE